MLSDRTQLQIQRFEEVLGRLHEVLVLNEDDMVRGALIHRFEATYEMACKSAWRALLDLGESVIESGPVA